MSRIFEALSKLEEDRQILTHRDFPPRHQVESADPMEEKSVSLSPVFLIETLREIKRAAGSIYKMGLPLIDKTEGSEDRRHYRKATTKAYDQIVTTVDMLSNYINVTSPIIKKNTIHHILDEILESNKTKFEARKIELRKSLAQALPETTFHDDQVKFILHSVLQYIILLTPIGGGIEITTRFLDSQKEEGGSNSNLQKSGYSEVSISSLPPASPFNRQMPAPPEVQEMEGALPSHFLQRLIGEMVRRNQGMIDFQMDRTKSRIRISLKLPAERRRVTYYRPANL